LPILGGSAPEIGFRPLSVHKSLVFREEGAKSYKIGKLAKTNRSLLMLLWLCPENN
jgi:hypothetical protein